MAANFIKADPTRNLTNQLFSAIRQVRDGMLSLEKTRAVFLQMRDGDGSQATHYDTVASEGGYAAGDYADINTAAKASFDELDSLYAKVATNASVSNVRAAIEQACAKHGL